MTVVMNCIDAIAGLFGWTFRNSARTTGLEAALKIAAASHGVKSDLAFARRGVGVIVDKASGKLMYAEFNGCELVHQVFNIRTLRRCEIVKSYAESGSNETTDRPGLRYLDGITLELESADVKQKILRISFYNDKLDKVSEMKSLFQKAWHLKRLISR